MKTLPLALLLCLLAVVLVACGGSSEDDYASDVSDVLNTLGTELTDAGELATDATGEDEVVAALSDSQEALSTAAGELGGIDPPEDVTGLHDELIAATEGYEDTVAETQESIESGAPLSDLSSFLGESQAFATQLEDLRTQFVDAGIPFEEGSE